MQRGYIKIWRKLEDSGLLQMHGTLSLFMVMLFRAAYKPCKSGLIELERGQLCAGRFQLMEWTGLSEQSVRTNLKHLHDMKIITSKPTNKTTIYTIVNYGQYQDIDTIPNQQTNQQLTNNQPTTNQQLTTIKELNTLSIKEVKKINNTYTPPIPEELLNEWQVIRKAKKSGVVTERVFKGIEREAQISGITAERAIEVCCEKGWASFDASWYKKQINGSGYKTADQQRNENTDKAIAEFLGNNGEVIDV